MSLVPDVPPKLFTLSAVAIGYLLIDDNSANEQNALGNWLMLIAQVLCTNAYFLQLQQERRGQTSNDQMSDEDTIIMMQKMINALTKEVENLKMDPEMIHRGINEGFSGGERKKNEILQMHILKPKIVMLDEIDSGLDVDSLKIVGNSVMDYFKEESPAVLLVTHYQRLLDYIKPDFVHVMENGKIIKSGDASLVKIIEEEGYDKIQETSTSVIKENVQDE
jgi:FeS assembly ATPase SufC